MHDIKPSNVLLSVHDNTCSAHVTSTSDHNNVTCVELDIISDFSLLEVELDCVVDCNQGVRVTDRSAVVRDNVRDTLGADGHPADLQELVRGFFGRDTVDGEPALDVVKETEVLARFLNRNDIWFTRL